MGTKFWWVTAFAVIALAGWLVYANTLDNPFVWDDENIIMRNAFIKNWSHVGNIFSSDLGAGAGTLYHSYRPLQVLTYLIDHSLWEGNVRGYHISNILVHILAACSFFVFTCLLCGDRTLALFAALLFVVNPLHTEAVTYISGRSDPLSALFLFIALICYLAYLDKGSKGWLAAVCAGYAASLLSKETAIVFPALIVIYHVVFKKPARPLGAAVIAGVTFIYAVFRGVALRALMPHTVDHFGLAQRLPGVFVALARYLKLLIAPFGLHMEYGLKIFRFSDPAAFAGMAAAVCLVAAIALSWQLSRLLAFSIAWFLITLLPVSNIYPINAYMAEHWLYLPSAGFFLIVAAGLRRLYRDNRRKTMAVVLFGALFIFYGAITMRQNAFWKDWVTFYSYTLRYAPDSNILHLNLGNAYLCLDRKEEAIEEYRKVIGLNPRNAKAYQNIGFVLTGMGRRAEAAEYLRKSLELKPDDAIAWNNLGNIYYDEGKMQDAAEIYRKAIGVNPYYGQAHYNLGNSLVALGDIDGAVASLTKAIEVSPGFVDAYNNLAMIYKALGRCDEAIAFLERALAIAPRYGLGHANISKLYSDAGKDGLAKKHAAIAAELGSK
ncbi:MAG: tetratricopeptide repeat protein [Candidatus Omnitrophica bacterium]|nr:tetratricopeptide repeat protein [Candidatus Omnitrophota bacterium]